METTDQDGFGALEALLILVIVGIIGFAGWFVYSSQQKGDKSLPKIPATNATKSSLTGPESSEWKIFTSKLEKVSFRYPADWKITKQEVEGDSEIFILAGPNNYLLTFSTYAPIPRGAESTPLLHLNKIDVPNFGPLYSLIPEYEEGKSNGIFLINYSPDLKDGDKASTFKIYSSKRTGSFENVNPDIKHYWVSISGYYEDVPDQRGNKYSKDFLYKEFVDKPEVIKTQQLFKTLTYL